MYLKIRLIFIRKTTSLFCNSSFIPITKSPPEWAETKAPNGLVVTFAMRNVALIDLAHLEPDF